jgi:hypothetical protein
MNDFKEIVRRILIVLSALIGYGIALFCLLFVVFSHHKNNIDIYVGIFGLFVVILTYASKKVIDWIFLKQESD